MEQKPNGCTCTFTLCLKSCSTNLKFRKKTVAWSTGKETMEHMHFHWWKSCSTHLKFGCFLLYHNIVYMETAVSVCNSVHYLVDVCYWECPSIESPLYSNINAITDIY